MSTQHVHHLLTAAVLTCLGIAGACGSQDGDDQRAAWKAQITEELGFECEVLEIEVTGPETVRIGGEDVPFLKPWRPTNPFAQDPLSSERYQLRLVLAGHAKTAPRMRSPTYPEVKTFEITVPQLAVVIRAPGDARLGDFRQLFDELSSEGVSLIFQFATADEGSAGDALAPLSRIPYLHQVGVHTSHIYVREPTGFVEEVHHTVVAPTDSRPLLMVSAWFDVPPRSVPMSWDSVDADAARGWLKTERDSTGGGYTFVHLPSTASWGQCLDLLDQLHRGGVELDGVALLDREE
jgi:hypothetical protein